MAEEKVPTFDIPKECKAGVVVNEGPDFHVEVQMVPVPEISMLAYDPLAFPPPTRTWLTGLVEPNEVLIKLNATGLCMSDVHFMLNDWALPKMSDLGTKCAGHEGAGVIVKVGSDVKTLKPGMRAGYKVCKRLWLYKGVSLKSCSEALANFIVIQPIQDTWYAASSHDGFSSPSAYPLSSNF